MFYFSMTGAYWSDTCLLASKTPVCLNIIAFQKVA